MSAPHLEVRADFDRDTIVVYQAFSDAIADAAVAEGTFVAPFSFERMTWIKPSFLWLMERSGWGTKPQQERTLAVRITRAGWEEALSLAELTTWSPRVHPTHEAWAAALETAPVRVQWDPERSAAGAKLEHRSIQVGLSRHIVKRYASEWIREIRDLTPLVKKLGAAKGDARKRGLPPEKHYPVPPAIARRLGM